MTNEVPKFGNRLDASAFLFFPFYVVPDPDRQRSFMHVHALHATFMHVHGSRKSFIYNF